MQTPKKIFITGIGTEVGKTIAAAIVTEALQADYWKPVQSGAATDSDQKTVRDLVSNSRSTFHPEAYLLQEPLSPHAAADLENVHIDIQSIQAPKTENHLVVEGAGGLMVPLNQEKFIYDLIQPEDKIILVSRHYLGSINHTLLSLDFLKRRFPQNKVGLLFNGIENPSTESIVLHHFSGVYLGRIDELSTIDSKNIQTEADKIADKLLDF